MNPPRPQRSSGESLFMAMPLAFAGILISAVAILAFLIWKGGDLSGPRVEMVFSLNCERPDVTQIQSIMKKRIDDIGLGEPNFKINSIDGKTFISLEISLPGLEGEFEKIPKVLSRAGSLTIRDDEGKILATKDNLQETSLALDESGMPYVGLYFDMESLVKMSAYVSSKPQSYMDIFVDNEQAAQRPNSVKVQAEEDFEIRIISEQGDVRERMQLAADRAIVLSYASYPCSINLDSIEELQTNNEN